MADNKYKLNYTGEQVNEAVGNALNLGVFHSSFFSDGIVENAEGNAMKIVKTGERSVRLEGGYLVVNGVPHNVGTLYYDFQDSEKARDFVFWLQYDKNSGEVTWVVHTAVRIEKNTMKGETSIIMPAENYDYTTNSGGIFNVPRNNDAYLDFVVGYLHIGAYTSSMSGITDLRGDDNFCGFVRYQTNAPEPTDKCVLLNSALFTDGVIDNEEGTALKITKTATMKARCEGGIIMLGGVPYDVKAVGLTYTTYDVDVVKVHYVRLYKNGNKPEWKAIEPTMHGEDDTGPFFLLQESSTGEYYQFPNETDDFIDIPIFYENIPAGTTEITQDMLHDLRLYEKFCGFARFKDISLLRGISGGKATKMINIDWSGDEENICELEYISNNELVVVQKSDGVNTIDAEGGIVKANIGNNGYFSSGFLVLNADEGDRYVLVAAKDGETISPVSSTAQ